MSRFCAASTCRVWQSSRPFVLRALPGGVFAYVCHRCAELIDAETQMLVWKYRAPNELRSLLPAGDEPRRGGGGAVTVRLTRAHSPREIVATCSSCGAAIRLSFALSIGAMREALRAFDAAHGAHGNGDLETVASSREHPSVTKTPDRHDRRD